MTEQKIVDSYKYLDISVRRLVKTWKKMETPKAIPWSPLSKPISECTVALISSAGLALHSESPFDQECERANPWIGDPSFRMLPKSVRSSDVGLYHLHMNPGLVNQDLNTIFPVQRLLELESQGKIKSSADHHYSYIGYTLQPDELLENSVPLMIHQMKTDQVDIVILVPG
jgi:D-proline reductase (dithiol) PrdB